MLFEEAAKHSIRWRWMQIPESRLHENAGVEIQTLITVDTPGIRWI
jgi:hypothetical protein